jgi:hypothetical protein
MWQINSVIRVTVFQREYVCNLPYTATWMERQGQVAGRGGGGGGGGGRRWVNSRTLERDG